MKLIYKKRIILIDKWFVPFFKALPWYFDQNGYLITTNWCTKNKKTGKRLKLHRLILLLENPKHKVDHINRKTYDNRLNNLRAVTSRENAWNMSLSKRNKLGISGVCWCPTKNKFKAEIMCKGVKKHLGYFTDKIEAGKKYQQAKKQRELYGRI